MKYIFLSVLCLICAACSLPNRFNKDAKVVVIGDSMFVWHRSRDKGIGNVIAKELNEPVADYSAAAARISHPDPEKAADGLEIGHQWVDRDAEWIIVNGGAVDLYMECLCLFCARSIDRLITPDGTSGEIVDLLNDMRDTGARVIYTGYHRSGGAALPVYDRCMRRFDEVENRVSTFADNTDGVIFADMRDAFPPGDRAYYTYDLIHTSALGSETIGKRLAALIKSQPQ